MTFVIPSANNLHEVAASSSDPRWLTNINSPTNTGVKGSGNLPITLDAKEFDNNTAGQVKGFACEFQASQASWNVSSDTKLMVWAAQLNAPNRIQLNTVANGGARVRIYSGTGSPPSAYKEYYLGGNDTPYGASIRGSIPFVIDLNDTSHEASAGSFSNTAVTSYAYLTNRLNMVGTNTNWNYVQKLYVFDTIQTSSSTPTFSGTGAEIGDAALLVQGTDYSDKLGDWVRQIGSVYFIDVGFRIGNNSTATTFSDDGVTVISPESDVSGDPRNRLTAQACRVYIYLRNNVADTATFSGTWIWGTRAPFDFGQSDSAVVTLSGANFSGMGAFEVGSSVSGNATFEDVGVVTMGSGADLDGSVFKSPFGAHLLSIG